MVIVHFILTNKRKGTSIRESGNNSKGASGNNLLFGECNRNHNMLNGQLSGKTNTSKTNFR